MRATTVRDLYVSTPKGPRKHGEIMKTSEGELILVRFLSELDKMRIYNAFALNPSALIECERDGVKTLVIHNSSDNTFRSIPIKDLRGLLDGKIRSGKKLVWRATWGGGPTLYIKDEAFKILKDKDTVVSEPTYLQEKLRLSIKECQLTLI